MLNIFTDNWDDVPVLNEGEHMYRIYVNNPMRQLYTITDLVGDELEEEVRFALRRQCGKWVHLLDIEDVSCVIYEEAEAKENATKATDEAWDGESWYTILWSDSGEYGEVRWYDTKDELFDDLLCAFYEATKTHQPFAVMLAEFDENDFEAYFGDFKEDFDIEAILEDTTMVIGGKRWTDTFGEDFDEAVKRHEL